VPTFARGPKFFCGLLKSCGQAVAAAIGGADIGAKKELEP
jgi:hypothetical protein